MRGRDPAALFATAAIAFILASSGPVFAAAPVETAPAPSKSVPTQTITPPPGAVEDGDGDAAPANTQPNPPPPAAAQQDEPVPVIEYDVSKLPPAVQALRQKILDAAKTGDINALKPLIEAGPRPTNLGASDDDEADPIAYLKTLSGDPDGRELLAILSEILEAGYVHVDVGTPDELYIWPYFARYPLDKLTPPQMVELFRLLTSSDYDEMKNYGAYLFYRVGITPNGQWSEFQAGD
ncbi:hypothetical protein OSH08_09685 [Kaistia geumhonensis]|uniref:Uncharacterized protein n=1 Tax=Kaistia geumhonensis TaxID=410839 RepID=A0ABU0M3T7_9HYPH|nr:hypothetical protein [Kaistia geumhonensis]MCX5479276.1 hypothetical protein [Kaistia geumhonensis]MDQ0515503.1 hypothetical protein [Kaistia geumhonensis]